MVIWKWNDLVSYKGMKANMNKLTALAQFDGSMVADLPTGGVPGREVSSTDRHTRALQK
jgi:hypothetical protein